MYKTKHFVIYSLESLFDDIVNFLIDLEWEMYDNISATNKVFRIPGEITRNNNLYVNLYYSGTTTLYYNIYNSWNNIAHTGTHSLVASSLLSRSFSTNQDFKNQANVFCCGNKDYFMFIWGSYYGSTPDFYGNWGVGYIPNVIYEFKQNCNNPVSAGSGVNLQLDAIGNIKKNGIYQLIDSTGNLGTELVTVSDVNESNNTVVIKNINNSYPNGVSLGVNTYNGFLISGNSITDLWSYDKIGTANNNNGQFLQNDIFYGYNYSDIPSTGSIKDHINPTIFLNKPIYKKRYSIYPFGHFNDEILSLRNNLNRNWVKTFIGVNNDNSSIKTNYSYPTNLDANKTYIEDSRRNWPVDSLAGKYIGFIAGSGAWQTRKILSNTASRITFVNPLIDRIDFTSQYIIIDKVYRVITQYGNNMLNLFALDTF